MPATMPENGNNEESLEEKLWRAVIASTVEEWVNGPLRLSRQAEKFLFDDNADYRTVCYSAGINPEHLRSRLKKFARAGFRNCNVSRSPREKFADCRCASANLTYLSASAMMASRGGAVW